jgi:hypothetical protein
VTSPGLRGSSIVNGDIWAQEVGKDPVMTLKGPFTDFAWSRKGDLAAAGDRVIVIRFRGGKEVRLTGWFSSIAWSADGRTLALDRDSGSVVLVNREGKTRTLPLPRLKAGDRWIIYGVFFGVRPRRLFVLASPRSLAPASTAYGILNSYDLSASTPRLRPWGKIVLSSVDVAVSPDGRYAAAAETSHAGACRETQSLTVVDLVSRRAFRNFNPPVPHIGSVATENDQLWFPSITWRGPRTLLVSAKRSTYRACMSQQTLTPPGSVYSLNVPRGRRRVLSRGVTFVDADASRLLTSSCTDYPVWSLSDYRCQDAPLTLIAGGRATRLAIGGGPPKLVPAAATLRPG